MDIIHSISPLKLVITGSLLIACIGAIVATIFFMRPQQVEIPQTRVGTYKFFSNISAEVRINDEHLGITPLSWQLYTPPPFTITFRDDNRTEYQFKVDNYPEDIAGFAVNFSKSKSPHPMITAETTPPGATVYINDVRYPLQTPCQLAAPESGQLKLTFKLNKYHDENIFILTNTGDFKLHTNLYPR